MADKQSEPRGGRPMNHRVLVSAFVLVCGFCGVTLILATADRSSPVAAQVICPPGQIPAKIASLADILLDQGAPPYARMILSRITLMPGESLDFTPSGYTTYYVESGRLEYASRAGLAITSSHQCMNPDGRYSGGGSFHVDADGLATISQGEALISDVIPIGPLRNSGAAPLVMLQMTLLAPEIDPATGLPIVDPGAAARLAARVREQHKEACRAAKLGTPVATAVPPPPFSTADWDSDAPERVPKLPKACRE
jgi:hypothetical protein